MPDRDLPRKAAARTARLAALPLGYAGRTALGLGKRLGGASAETVLTDIQQRTAEQLFRTLGELKGGAMKFGQALSVLEAALPEEIAGPYREQLTRLQDAAPPMPTQTVRDQIAKSLGPDWQDQLVWLDGGPTAAAIDRPGAQGPLARRPRRRGQGAVPRRRRGADVRPAPDRPARPHRRAAGARRRHQAAGRGDAGARDRRARLRARGRGAAGLRRGVPRRPRHRDPGRRRPGRRGPRHRVAGEPGLPGQHHPRAAPRRSATTTASCSSGSSSTAQPRTGMLHADPHPGNFRILPNDDGSPGRLGILDFGAVARLGPGGSRRRWAR